MGPGGSCPFVLPLPVKLAWGRPCSRKSGLCALVPIKSRRQSLEEEKEQLYCFARQRRTQQADASKLCPELRGDSNRTQGLLIKVSVVVFVHRSFPSYQIWHPWIWWWFLVVFAVIIPWPSLGNEDCLQRRGVRECFNYKRKLPLTRKEPLVKESS